MNKPVKDVTKTEILNALNNIRATLQIQVSRGNKDAEWLMRHL